MNFARLYLPTLSRFCNAGGVESFGPVWWTRQLLPAAVEGGRGVTKPDDMYVISAARSGSSLQTYKHICSKFWVRFLNYPDVKSVALPLEASAPHSSSLLGSAGSILSVRQSRGRTGIKCFPDCTTDANDRPPAALFAIFMRKWMLNFKPQDLNKFPKKALDWN